QHDAAALELRMLANFPCAAVDHNRARAVVESRPLDVDDGSIDGKCTALEAITLVKRHLGRRGGRKADRRDGDCCLQSRMHKSLQKRSRVGAGSEQLFEPSARAQYRLCS